MTSKSGDQCVSQTDNRNDATKLKHRGTFASIRDELNSFYMIPSLKLFSIATEAIDFIVNLSRLYLTTYNTYLLSKVYS
jgi:hypothetical protein